MLLFGIELYALIAADQERDRRQTCLPTGSSAAAAGCEARSAEHPADGNTRRLLPGAERPATTESSLAGRVVTLPWLQLRNIEHIITRYYLKPQSPFGQRAATGSPFYLLFR